MMKLFAAKVTVETASVTFFLYVRTLLAVEPPVEEEKKVETEVIRSQRRKCLNQLR